MCQSELFFLADLTELAAELSEFSQGFAKGVAGTVSLPIFSVFFLFPFSSVLFLFFTFLPCFLSVFFLFFLFLPFVPFLSVFFPFPSVFLPFSFRFFPFLSVLFCLFSVFIRFFFRFIFREKLNGGGDTVRETPSLSPETALSEQHIRKAKGT